MSTSSIPTRDLPLSPAAVPVPSPRTAVPFARQRLRLGIVGVGTSVVLAISWIVAIATGGVALSSDWTPLGQSLGAPLDAALAALMVFAVHALLMAPLEYVGGARVVRRRPSLGAWLVAWVRGIAVLGALVALSATAFAAVGSNVSGPFASSPFTVFGTALLVVVLSIALLAAQGPIARLVAALPVRETDPQVRAFAAATGVPAARVRVTGATDESFVGGWVGLRNPELWVPAHWTEAPRAALLAVQLARRNAQLVSGARWRGVWGAIAWNAVGMLVIAALLPWGFDEARTYLVLPAAATLWSFLGVLFLPTPSRAAVYAADRAVLDAVGHAAVSDAITQLDRWQDDEAERSARVERVFHPVPSRGNRLRALTVREERADGAHQLTRLALFSSLATMSLLGRVVHCNVGRPALWVIYPGD
jgi:hypothetical protein